MSWGFEEGKVYNRRADIHAKFGGQQQGGIITPSQHPLVIIITRVLNMATRIGLATTACSNILEKAKSVTW
jgi:hypothetical protein